jgi:hypothetical protein
MNILKGILAVLAGFIFIVVTHTGTDFVLHRLGIFPAPEQGFHITWMVVTATIYRSIYTVGGGYLTAALAPANAICNDSRINRARIRHPCRNCDNTNETRARLVSDCVGRPCSALCVVRWKVEN